MLNKLFSHRTNKSNALQMNISLNLDGPFSLRDREQSFLSYHTQEGNMSSNDIEFGQSEREIDYANQNFTAIFNNPTSFLDEVFSYIQELFSSSKVQETNLPEYPDEEFNSYILKYSKEFSKYESQKFIEQADIQKNFDVDINKSLLSCYREIPKFYFDENFHMNFSCLNQEISGLNEEQEKLSEYLDDIEINLFYQITRKFNDIFKAVVDLKKMENEIDSSLEYISTLRSYNQNLYKFVDDKGKKILKAKKRQNNIVRVKHLMNLIQTCHQIGPILENLIEKGNFTQAVILFNKSQDIMASKLKGLDCLSPLKSALKEQKSFLEKSISNEISNVFLDFVGKSLSYKKAPDIKDLEISYAEESFMNATYMNEPTDFYADEEVDTHRHHLPWFLNELAKDSNAEIRICRLLVDLNGLGEISLKTIRIKLGNVCKDFFRKFSADASEFLGYGTLQDSMMKADFVIYLKFIIFFSQVMKKGIEGACRLCIEFLDFIFNKRMLDVNKQSKQIDELLEEIFAFPILMCKFLSDKIVELSSMRMLEELSVHNFRQFYMMVRRIERMLEHEIPHFFSSENIDLPVEALGKIQIYLTKMYTSSFLAFLKEVENSYMNSFTKMKLSELKIVLESENWKEIDLPIDFLDYLSILIEKEEKETLNTSFYDDTILSFREQKELEDGIESLLSQRKEVKSSRISRIVKNELWIDEKRYRMTTASYIFTKTLTEFIQLIETISYSQKDYIAKFLEHVKFYSSYSFYLILGQGATEFNVKVVTTKMISLSVSILNAVNEITTHVEKRLERQRNVSLDWLSGEFSKIRQELCKHKQELLEKLINILQSRIKEKGESLKDIDWSSQKTKINIPTKNTAHIFSDAKQMLLSIEDNLLEDEYISTLKDIVTKGFIRYIHHYKSISIENKNGAMKLKEEMEYILNEIQNMKDMDKCKAEQESLESNIYSFLKDNCLPYLERKTIN